MPAVALTIAGSDSGGGAGIQADLKTFRDHGVFGTSAIAAVTAQNTTGVTRIDAIPVEGLVAQIEAVLSDLPVAAVKIGMLGTAEHVLAVVRCLADVDVPIVLDPVMVASTGARLLASDAVRAVREELLPLATLVTPNLPEAALLADGSLVTWTDRCPVPLLVTGGDAGGAVVRDVLYLPGQAPRVFEAARVPVDGPDDGFHGTGCTLSSAIAARLAKGDDLETAVEGGLRYVQALVAGAWRPGAGHHTLLHGI
ncbi:MAG: bifunctional hydroxymethylpyrimidine kinase/phosphomethylpyrimidine kinase [Deltaproteobacteria bacterium]|nr:MAG: bifunctional hydroxymethylpyrimidine kinase/phosphomethylpyrimidine kinase [Deltaproteobacteria bacterium]